MNKNFYNKISSVFAIAALALAPIAFPEVAVAASLTNVSDTQSSLKISALSSHKIVFTTPTGITASKTVILTFPQTAPNYNFTSKTFADVTITWGPSTGLENSTTTAAAAAATVWGVAFAGTGNSQVTLSSPTGASSIPAASKVIVTLNSSNSINPNTAATYQLGISGNFGDVGTTTEQILNDDQVQVSATVPQTLTFSMSANSVQFGTITPGTPRYASSTVSGSNADTIGNSLSVTTNAASGYTLTATGTTLTSGANTITAIGGAAVVANPAAEQFGMYAVATGGSGTVSSPFSTASQFAYTAGSLQTIATAAGASNTTTYSMHYLANAIGTTEAGAYNATITYTATANY